MPFSGQDTLFADAVERLRAAVSEDRPIDAAQLHLINLQEIIRRAGPHWPLIKDQIRLGSLRFLKGCLGDADIVLPAGDGFLVIFAQGEPAALKARAEEMRALLLEFYMFQQWPLRELQVTVEQRQIEPRELGALVMRAPKPVAEPSTDACVFAPAWSPGPQVIASYFCVPVHREAGGPRYGYDPLYLEEGRHEHRDYGQLDVAMLDVIERALERCAPGETQPALGVSVHSTTMQNRAARAAFLERLSRIPPEAMKHLSIKIAEIEPGAPIIMLADWAGMLRARVRNILLECHYREPAPPDLLEVGVWGAGYRAPPPGTSDPEVAMHLSRWGDSLGRQRKRFFVDHLSRVSMVRVAAGVGAAFVTGDAFWPFQKWPSGVHAAAAPAAPFPAPQKSLSSAAI